MKIISIFLLGVTFAYAARSNLLSIPKEVKKNERTRSLTLGTMDTWWLNIRRALEPLVPPKVMSELDVNVPDGFIVYPFQYPHYLKPQTRRLVFAIPPLFKNTVETKKPAGSQQPLKPLKTYQFLDPPFANYQQSGVRILDQNSLNVNNDLVQPLNLAYQKPNNYDRPFYNEQNNHNLARLKQIRLDKMDQNSVKIVDPEHQAEFEGNDASYVVVDDLYTPADFYTYNIVGM